MFCDSIVKNKQIGLYDGAYKCVALATGTTWERPTGLQSTEAG